MKEERLQKVIRDLINISRRDAELLIMKGEVFLNGQKAEIGVKAREGDKIKIQGQEYTYGSQEAHRYYAVYKPTGYASTNEDEHAKKLVTELIPNGYSLKIAGRLDMNSEGLMILTSDGDLVYRLTHPKFEVEKVYEVTILGQLSDQQIAKIRQGTQYEEGIYKVRDIQVLAFSRNSQVLRLVLTEGKKREIREILRLYGKEVITLKRLAIGPFSLQGLKPGEYRSLSKSEIATLVAQL